MHIIAYLKYISIMLLTALSCSTLACPVENKSVPITVNGHELIAEIATNPAGHRCGLSFRKQLPADRGMLFVYPQDRVLSFWMRNTRIDLSIAFLDRDGRILEMHDMNSDDQTRQTVSSQPARFAMEVNQGWFAEHGIEVGDRLVFDLQSNADIFSHQPQQ